MKTLRLSTKTKKEIRYFSSLVLLLAASLILLASLTSCSTAMPKKDDGTSATVKALRVLGGYGLDVRLKNNLIPSVSIQLVA